MNYQIPPDDDDPVDDDYPCGFTPGMADPASADSFDLWRQGLLENPLMDDDLRAEGPAEQDNDGPEAEETDVEIPY